MGYQASEDKWEKENAAQAIRNANAVSKIVENTEAQTRRLYEKRIRDMEKALKLPRACDLPVEYRILHDLSTGLSEVATTSPVAAEDFALTVAENYNRCLQNIIWLEECNATCK